MTVRALNGLKMDQTGVARAGVTAADSATLTDANIPPAQAIDCRGLDTIYVGVEFTGGTGPTATFEILYRDPVVGTNTTPADGARWKRKLLGAPNGVTTIAAPAAQTTGALDGTALSEQRVDGRSQVFIRCTNVTGSPTSFDILVMPGARRYSDNWNE